MLKIPYIPVLLSLVCCWFAAPALAQQYNFQNYSVADGLAQSQVHCLLEDRRSFIWMGTQGGGLCRFDGLRFETFETKDGLAGNYVEALLEDRSGQIWIGTQNGLTRYDGHRFHTFRIGPGPSPAVYSLAEDTGGRIWLGTSMGVYHFAPQEGDSTLVFESFSRQHQLPLTRVNGLLASSDGSLWVGHSAGLIRIAEAGAIRYDRSSGHDNYQVQALLEDRRGRIWIATADGGVHFIDDEGFQLVTTTAGLASNRTTCLLEDIDGRIWIGTRDAGISIWDPVERSFSSLRESDGLEKNDVRSIISDRWNNVWIGTSGGGLSKYVGQQFRHFDREEGLSAEEVHAICPDGQHGGIWLGTETGLTHYNGSHFTDFSQDQGFLNVGVESLLRDDEGRIWVGTTSRGLFRYDAAGFSFMERRDGLASNRITAIAQDTAGHLWVATPPQGLTKIVEQAVFPDPDSLRLFDSLYRLFGLPTPRNRYFFQHFGEEEGMPDLRSQCLAIDAKNRIWVGTQSGGITIFENDRLLRLIGQSDGLPDQNVRVLTADPAGFIWVGTASGGMARIDTDSFTIRLIDQSMGLSTNKVNAIAIDILPEGGPLIWVGSHLGVDRILLDAERKAKQFQHYGRAEGFEGRETTQNAVWRDSSGTVWFGTMNGLMQYLPGTALKNEVPPNLHLTDVQLGYTSFRQTEYADWITPWGELRDGLVLPYRDNDLNFEFKAINLRNPGSVRYQWTLEPYDSNWSPPTDQRSVRYAKLPSGEYRFKLRAINEDGVYHQPPLEYRFSIRAPIWQRWWFQLSALSVLLFLIFGLFRLRVNRIRSKARAEREKIELEKHLIELEQKALQLQMNPHFIFNALNSIQALIVRQEPAQARFQLAKFSKLMRNMLEHSRSTWIALDSEIELLENYLTVEKNSRNACFLFDIVVDQDLAPEEILIPPMLIQPFVENAIIHGIQTVKDGRITIVFGRRGKWLECTITDNGIGRTAAMQRKSQIDQQHKSMALEVTRERLDILAEGPAGKDKSLEITDLVDNGGVPTGTRVVLRIPLKSH